MALSPVPGAAPLVALLDALEDLATAVRRVSALWDELPTIYRPTFAAGYPAGLPAFEELAATLATWADQFTHPADAPGPDRSVPETDLPAFLRRR
jgi:hypothetical protein